MTRGYWHQEGLRCGDSSETTNIAGVKSLEERAGTKVQDLTLTDSNLSPPNRENPG